MVSEICDLMVDCGLFARLEQSVSWESPGSLLGITRESTENH